MKKKETKRFLQMPDLADLPLFKGDQVVLFKRWSLREVESDLKKSGLK